MSESRPPGEPPPYDPSQPPPAWGDQPSAPPPPPPPPAPPPPPPAQGYGQQDYGQPPSYAPPPPQVYGPAQGASAAGTFQGRPLAEWPKRAGSFLIDGVLPFIAVFIVAAILGAISDALGLIVGLLGYLAAVVWTFYNAYLGGQTGQSFGKKQLGIRLLSEQTGQPIGGGMGIARAFVHIVDGIPCYVGYLWPLWDPKKQTFTDKILSTVVIDEGTR